MQLPTLPNSIERIRYVINTFYEGKNRKLCYSCDIKEADLSKVLHKKIKLAPSILEKISKGPHSIPYEWLSVGTTDPDKNIRGEKDLINNVQQNYINEDKKETNPDLEKENIALKAEVDKLKQEIEKLKKIISMLVQT